MSQPLLQLAVLVLKLLQPLGFGHLHAAEFPLPIVEGCLADPVLTAKIRRLRTRLVLLQNTDESLDY
jgi:hypothetical protein